MVEIDVRAGQTYQIHSTYYNKGDAKTWKLYWFPPENPRCGPHGVNGTHLPRERARAALHASQAGDRRGGALGGAHTYFPRLNGTFTELLRAIDEAKDAAAQLVYDQQEALANEMGSPNGIQTIASLRHTLDMSALTDGDPAPFTSRPGTTPS